MKSLSSAELNLMTSTAIILAWMNKPTINDVSLQQLKKEAKELGLNLLRNKDKNTHVKAVASTLLSEKKVIISDSVKLDKVCRDDIQLPNLST